LVSRTIYNARNTGRSTFGIFLRAPYLLERNF